MVAQSTRNLPDFLRAASCHRLAARSLDVFSAEFEENTVDGRNLAPADGLSHYSQCLFLMFFLHLTWCMISFINCNGVETHDFEILEINGLS